MIATTATRSAHNLHSIINIKRRCIHRDVFRLMRSASIWNIPFCSSSFKLWQRCLTTTPKGRAPVPLNDDSGDEEEKTYNDDYGVLKSFPSSIRPIVDTTTRSVGQVIFLNSATSGMFILGGLAYSSPFLATLATVGSITANATAKVCELDKQALNDGMWGYNGCLVGCAASVFVNGDPSSLVAIAAATTFTIVGSAVTPFVAASLKEAMNIPQWTVAFNIVTLTSLLRTPPLKGEVPTDVVSTAATTTTNLTDLLVSPLTGISQIFVVESAICGTIITYSIGRYSPGLACHAVVGSTVGSLVGYALGADATELCMGLWGFNSALTSMAVGVFFVHSTPAMLLSSGGAAATAALLFPIKGMFSLLGSPCLTLPFCITMSGCYLLGKQIPSLKFAKIPHSPEKNG